MTNKSDSSLLFFRSWPDGIEQHAPLLSALQKIDTSFLMISQFRFPHAFTTFSSALESALKAGLNIPREKRADFKKLLDEANHRYPGFTSISSDSTKILRDTRNNFEHFGFSPDDDSESARLLLETGYQLLDDWLAQAFCLSLLDRGETRGCLDWETEKHLKLSMRFFHNLVEQGSSNFTTSFRAFGHNIRWRLRHNYMSSWESELSNEENSQADLILHNKDSLISHWLYHWIFDCPVCGEHESFVCELGDLYVDLRIEDIVIKQGQCVNCDFILPPALSWMGHSLCEDQLESALSGLSRVWG